MVKRTLMVLFQTLLLLGSECTFAQGGQLPVAKPATVSLSPLVLNRLPIRYRDEAKSLVTATVENQQRLLKDSDEDLTGSIIGELGQKPEAVDFLLSQLPKEPSGTLRCAIINTTMPSLDQMDWWWTHANAEALLEQELSSDPEPEVSLCALKRLQNIQMTKILYLLHTRVNTTGGKDASTKVSSDFADPRADTLADEEEFWFRLRYHIMLPTFLRVPPPVFSVVPDEKSIRVLAFGDFGTGSIAQNQTATAMRSYNREHHFDLGLTLGDNFYIRGMDSVDDPRWKTEWEDLYGPLGIKFYPTFGNHDYGQSDSAAAEILYSGKSPDWCFPSAYYTFTAGPVQFFAIDTTDLSEAELRWLDQELSRSKARWKVVYGHHPIFSSTAPQVPSPSETGGQRFLSIDDGPYYKLMPLLKGRVDIYLSGHHHNLQELKPEGGVHFFVSGGGGQMLYQVNPYDRSVYAQKVNGFTVLEADDKQFKVSFIGTDGRELHSSTIKK